MLKFESRHKILANFYQDTLFNYKLREVKKQVKKVPCCDLGQRLRKSLGSCQAHTGIRLSNKDRR